MPLDFGGKFDSIVVVKKKCYRMSKGTICLEFKHNIFLLSFAAMISFAQVKETFSTVNQETGLWDHIAVDSYIDSD